LMTAISGPMALPCASSSSQRKSIRRLKERPAGSHLLLLFASVNDDDTVFACPRVFDLNRKNVGRHLSFGAGAHLCVGMTLARMEIRIAVREIMRRLIDFKLAVPPDAIRYVPTIATMTIESLPLSFRRKQ